MKIIDVDKLFEKFMRKYVAEHSGRYSEEEWYEQLPELYRTFENTPFPELDGKTPAVCYDDEPDLVSVWKEYIIKGVPLNDYLLDAVTKRVSEGDVLSLLTEDADEELLLSAVDVLRRKNSKNAVYRYIDLLFSKKICHHVKDEMVEDVINEVDGVYGEILSRLDGKTVDSMFAEILSNVKVRDDRIKKILLDGLEKGDKVPEYAAYFVNYGDESCLGELCEYIKKVDDYVSFKELKLAIEALGGLVDTERDFTFDKDYLKIKAAKRDNDKDKQ